MLAVAVLPFPPSVEATALVVLFCVPAAVPETFTANVHEAPAVRVAPVRLTLPEPAFAVIDPPLQLPERPFGVATTRPVGSVSVKPIPPSELLEFGLDRLKVSEVAPFNVTLAAPKDFEIVGGRMVGGGGELPEEPPPHPEAHARPRRRMLPHKRNRDRFGTIPLTPRRWREAHQSKASQPSYPNFRCEDIIFAIRRRNPTKVGVEKGRSARPGPGSPRNCP